MKVFYMADDEKKISVADQALKGVRGAFAHLTNDSTKFDQRYGEGAFEQHQADVRARKEASARRDQAYFAFEDEVDRRLWNTLVESQARNKTGLDGIREAAPFMMMMGGVTSVVGTGLAMGASAETTPNGKPLPKGFKYDLSVERARKAIRAEVEQDEKLGRISFESGKLEVIKPEELDTKNRIQPDAPKASSPSAPRAAPSTPKNKR